MIEVVALDTPVLNRLFSVMKIFTTLLLAFALVPIVADVAPEKEESSEDSGQAGCRGKAENRIALVD